MSPAMKAGVPAAPESLTPGQPRPRLARQILDEMRVTFSAWCGEEVAAEPEESKRGPVPTPWTIKPQ